MLWKQPKEHVAKMFNLHNLSTTAFVTLIGYLIRIYDSKYVDISTYINKINFHESVGKL